ncbi:TPA: hypothetical protein ACYR9J_003640, partial [Klebsiella pneumoniae]|nr:hypothetical protein [Klebsiella pneumoniae]HDU2730968.1 hypothetical protein [Klebsiella pneumoniae]
MSKSFPEWWKHGQKVRTANDGVLTLNIAEDSEYWLTNNAGKEVSVFSMDILGPASVPEACRMTTDITELAQMKGQKVEAPYYLAECTECGKMYPSSQLIESRNYMDGDADCYCPHCNATDPDIADCGSEGVTAWNYQQARIDALVEALEKAQAVMNAVVTAAAIRGVRPFDGIDCDPPTLEENAEACGDAMSARIRELEANPPKPHHNGLMQISNELASA